MGDATQTFLTPEQQAAAMTPLPPFPGSTMTPLGPPPAPGGSVHLLRMAAGTRIGSHVHPAAEYVRVLAGELETGGRRVGAGTSWHTPAGCAQGPHVAVTDVQLLTVRLGPMGAFAEDG